VIIYENHGLGTLRTALIPTAGSNNLPETPATCNNRLPSVWWSINKSFGRMFFIPIAVRSLSRSPLHWIAENKLHSGERTGFVSPEPAGLFYAVCQRFQENELVSLVGLGSSWMCSFVVGLIMIRLWSLSVHGVVISWCMWPMSFVWKRWCSFFYKMESVWCFSAVLVMWSAERDLRFRVRRTSRPTSCPLCGPGMRTPVECLPFA
jgi:hypothetical protein